MFTLIVLPVLSILAAGVRVFPAFHREPGFSGEHGQTLHRPEVRAAGACLAGVTGLEGNRAKITQMITLGNKSTKPYVSPGWYHRGYVFCAFSTLLFPSKMSI